jgi:CBS domain-containing protein
MHDVSETEDGYRLPPFEKARVRDAMHPGVVFCTPKTPLRAVARIMAERRIHSVIVSDLDMPVWKHRWGVVSDIELLGAAADDPDSKTADQVAESELRIVDVDDKLSHAAQVMAKYRASHVVVVEDEGRRAVGVLSSLDIARVLAQGRS